MKTRKILLIILACILLIGIITKMTMNNKGKEPAGYIGRSEIEIKGALMTPEVLLSLGRLSDPQLSPDGTKILYGVSYTSIEDNRSCRNLFICNVDGKEGHQISFYAKSVSNARWNEDGSAIYFIQGGQMWSAPLKGYKLGKKVQLSDVPAGISEFKISPDGANVMYVSSIKSALETPEDTDPVLDKAEAYATEDLMYRHWDHWVTETPRTYVAPFAGAMITPDNSFDILGSEVFELPAEPFSGIEQLDWAPDSRHIAYSCRKKTGIDYAFSTDTEVYLFDILTGATVRIPMDGGYDTDPVWSHDGSKLAWVSMERDGYESDRQRIMIADIKFGQEEQSGEMLVSGIRELAGELDRDCTGIVWSADDSEIYFNALNDGLQAIYSVDLGSGKYTRLTPEDWWFDFSSPFAIVGDGAGSTSLLTTFCSLNFPDEIVKVSINEGKEPEYSRITYENDHILSKLAKVKCEKRYVKTVDGQNMLTWVLFPPEFDAAKQYPAIEICLGGPQGTLSQGWSYRWNYRLMAAQGYIVAMPNRRGTTAFGQAWKEEISGDYSGLNIQDYLSCGRELKAEPYVSKLAACGASYGGYSVYYLAGVHENLYDCFIAHAGIFDEAELYYTTEEMWFADWDNGGLGRGRLSGSPWSKLAEPQRHYAHSPHLNVEKWNTPIMCIHGGMDFRIPYTQGMAAFNCAQYMGVPSKLVVFPEETHWILQPQNALYWHRTYFDWLDRWMK